MLSNHLLLETKKTEEDLMVLLFVLRLPFSAESHILYERSHQNEQRSGKIVLDQTEQHCTFCVQCCSDWSPTI